MFSILMDMKREFLTEEQYAIVDEVFKDRLSENHYYFAFRDDNSICLDGDFSLDDLKTFVEAMERMQKFRVIKTE